VGGLPETGGVEPSAEISRPVGAGHLRVELVAETPVAVVAVSGALTRADGASACQQLVEALAVNPLGLVVDLGDLVVDAAAGASLLPVAAAIRAWPERPFAMCRRPSTLRPPNVPIFLSRELACGYVTGFSTLPQRSQMLDREPAASQEARRLVTHACAEWQLDAITPTAQLVVTELVNNAVLHTGDRFLVTVTLTDEGIHVAVRDTSREQPRVRAPEKVDVYGGKGMTLVEAFAHAWGTTLVSDGKVVWADLRA
jgi:hypothetical protein